MNTLNGNKKAEIRALSETGHHCNLMMFLTASDQDPDELKKKRCS